MATAQEIIEAVRHAFSAELRPEHFTNYTHCCECAEHHALLASRDLQSLHLEDVNNAGWDPICFATAEGFRYYSFQEKDFSTRYIYAALANPVGRLHRDRISSGVLANFSSACSTFSVSAAQVGKYWRCVPSFFTFFQSFSSGL